MNPGKRVRRPLIAPALVGDMWNDPKLVADNPVLANVNQSIVVVHRSDGSGTTFGFTDYLSNVSPDWQSRVGKGNLSQTAEITQKSEAFIKQINVDGTPIFPGS